MILGTAAYMSPEQARGRATDRRSDVWAFGAVLYEMLTGRRAFPGEDVTDTVAAVVRSEPDWAALGADVPPVRQYDVTADGQRFLMLRRPVVAARDGDAVRPKIVLVENFFEELKRLVPVN